MEANHILYMTINLINGKYYYGVHDNKNPKYLGSGVALTQAISKYGRDNFVRKTVAEGLTEDEAYELEELIVDEREINKWNCYNMQLGGLSTGKKTDEHKRKISEGHKGMKKPWVAERNRRPDVIAKISGPNPKKGVKWTDERKKAFSKKWTNPYSKISQGKFLGYNRKKLEDIFGPNFNK